MNRKKVSILLFALLATCGAWAEPTWTVASRIGTKDTFVVTRSESTYAQTVLYRTVNLSAYAGQHYTAASGSLTFGVGETVKKVAVARTTPSTDAYKYQNGTTRSYRFEVTDRGGFYLAHCLRTGLTTGINIPNTAFAIKDVTVNSGTITVTDDNYSQAYHAVSVSTYFSSAPKAYLQFVGADLRMTLSFQAKEKDDGYQHVQMLVNQTSNHDEGAGDNNPGTINYSKYMACFVHKGGSTNTTYSNYVFPDVNHGNNCGNVGKVWTSINSSNDVGELRQQKFNTNCRATDGRLIISTNSALSSFNTLGIRFDASGNNEDTWYAYNTVAHIQAVDNTAPTKLAVSVNPGRHAMGNTVYVSVAFSEIVTVTGTPTLTASNNWGTLTYTSGTGSNVLTFMGTIPQEATGSLGISRINGTVKDLAGNSLSGGVSASNLCSLDGDLAYTLPDFQAGSMANEYLITCHDDLRGLAGYVNGGNGCSGLTFRQVSDLVFPHSDNWNLASSTEHNYTAIGTSATQFQGTYDGGGHTVSGIRIYKGAADNAADYHGLFGYLNGGTVRNVHLADTRITGDDYIGGIAGKNSNNGTVEDCSVAADVCIHAVVTNANYHGGITGYNSGETITQRCVSRATLTVVDATGCDNYGGITGQENCSMNDCLVIGAVIPAVNQRGAIAGSMSSGSNRQRNYYRACTVAGVANATGVGTGSGDITTYQGARALYALTLAEHVVLDRSSATLPDTLPGTGNTTYTTYTTGADIDGQPYAYATASLALSYDGLATGHHVVYDTAGVALTGNSFAMPAHDLEVGGQVLANSYSVHFEKNNNDATGTMADQAFTYGVAQPLTANAFSGSALTFDGWNTANDGTGTPYGDGQTVLNLTDVQGATVTLYGQWTDHCPRPTLATSSITNNSASLSWSGSATSWTLEYGTASDFAGATAVSILTSATYALTSLSTSTTYYVRVKAICSGEYQSAWSNTVSFTTDCDAITSFPWTENFENFSNSNELSDPCWQNRHLSGDGTQLFKVSSSSQYNNTTKKLYLPNMSSGTLTMLRLPRMNLTADNYEFVLDVCRNTNNSDAATSEGIRVYLSTTGEIEGATELAFISRRYNAPANGIIPAESSAGWYTYHIPLGNVSGHGHIILRGESRNKSATYMDNFVVQRLPSCSTPTSLAASAISTTSTIISWTQPDGGTPLSYTLYYKKSGDADYTPVDGITTTSYTLTTEPASNYRCYVRAHCDNGLATEPSRVLHFTSACNVVTVTDGNPYLEDFDSYTSTATGTGRPSDYPDDDLPPCWEFPGRSTQQNTAPMVYLSADNSYASAGNCLYFLSSYNTDLYALLPEFTNAVSDLLLSFTYRNKNNWGCPELQVGYLTDPADPATFVEVYTCPRTTTLTRQDVFFPGAPANCRIAFKYGDRYNSFKDLSIDDISVRLVPTCLWPADLTTSDIYGNRATLSWSERGTATQWDICVNGDEAHPITVTSSSYTLTGLTGETTYNVKVRSRCSDSDQSDWSYPVSFTTDSPCQYPSDLVCTAVTTTTATLAWTENGNATEWKIILNGDGANPIVANTTPYTLTGLAENSSYNVQVVVTCDDASNYYSGSISFVTAQTPVALPYSTGFEDGGNNGWMLANGGMPNAWAVDSATSNDGSQALYVSDDFGVTNQYSGYSSLVYAYKTFTFAAGNYVVAYDWKCEGESEYDYLRVALVPETEMFKAGVFPAGFGYNTLPEGWIALDGGTERQGFSSWQHEEHAVAVTAAGTYKVVFIWVNDGGTEIDPPAAVDNVSISLATCYPPSELEATSVSDDGAQLGWTGFQEGYRVRYRTCTFGAIHDEDFSGQTPVNYLADDGQLPTGWNTAISDGGNAPRVSNQDNYSYIGDFDGNYLLMTTATENQTVYAIMPQYSDIAEVEFMYAYENSRYGTCSVGYVTDASDMSTFQLLQTPLTRNYWSSFMLSADDLTAVNSASGRRLAFRYVSSSSTYYSVALDNIVVRCGKQVSNWVEKSAASSPLTLANLEPCTIYEWQVQGVSNDCDGGGVGYTVWSSTARFTTLNPTAAVDDAVWMAISSPMHDEGQSYLSLANVTNLTNDAYDLFRYEETAATWQNVKASPFNLDLARGYIYRRTSAATLTYNGEPNRAASYSIALTATPASGDLKGFNLVGNPYPYKVLLDRAFFELQPDGTWQAHLVGDSLAIGQGALVYTASGETLTFYAATRSTNSGAKGYLPPLPDGLSLGDGSDQWPVVSGQQFAYLDGDKLVITGEGTLEAYDMMGRKLFVREINSELRLPNSDFPSGVYVLRLGEKSQKIVIR